MKYGILFSLLLVGCAKNSVRTIPTNNSEFEVAFLFEAEGCKVYRFYDSGHYRYFTTCKGSTSCEYKQNKNATRTETIPTN